jgi:predicted dehydrogenase
VTSVGIGVVGCGVISEIYIRNLQQLFRDTEVVAVSDLVLENAERRAAQFGIPVVCRGTEELVAREDVGIVLNLTIPRAHAAVSRLGLEAGKHVYTEKPLALGIAEGRELVSMARERGVLFGSAPDTFLGSAVQTARKLLDEGWIGHPFAIACHMLRAGPESWHPHPAFLYQEGAGPLFDSGPYSITVLTYLLGPIESVTCSARITYPERTITSQPRYGERIPVEVPTFVAGLLDFASGTIGTLVMSVDVENSRQQDLRQHKYGIEVYGSEGTLSVPSPSYFDGQIYLRRNGAQEWAEIPSIHAYREDSRGLGVADMASAVLRRREPRASADMAYHVHEVLHRLDESWRTGDRRPVESRFGRTEPLSPNLRPGEVDQQ